MWHHQDPSSKKTPTTFYSHTIYSILCLCAVIVYYGYIAATSFPKSLLIISTDFWLH